MPWRVCRVVERRQDFHTTRQYPYGWIVETLACGAEHIEAIELKEYISEDPKKRHVHSASRRRHWHPEKE